MRHWHGVLTETDEMASHPASVDLVAMLVRFMEPRVVVEAGTYGGHVALAVANILRQTSHGIIHTADLTDNFSKTLAQVPTLQPHIHWHHGDFAQMLAGIEEPIDLAYIDASDTNNPHLRWEHAESAYAKMRPGGLILIDDTESPDWGDAPRFRYWAKDHGLHLCQHRGLSIIQKERFERA